MRIYSLVYTSTDKIRYLQNLYQQNINSKLLNSKLSENHNVKQNKRIYEIMVQFESSVFIGVRVRKLPIPLYLVWYGFGWVPNTAASEKIMYSKRLTKDAPCAIRHYSVAQTGIIANLTRDWKYPCFYCLVCTNPSP